MVNKITSGGPPKDGITPIEDPVYVSVSKADEFLKNYDKVFYYESNDKTYIYPQSILVWHEIVNEKFDGENVSITYCPLTGSTIAYLGSVGDIENTDYGTSGKLLNSNLIMYDRKTESYIPQIFGIGITGDLEGVTLDTKPIYWANWDYIKDNFPESKVLSRNTGYVRDYDKDPYGSYKPDESDSYYYNDGILFPLVNEYNGDYGDKKIVIGVKVNDKVTALSHSKVKKEKIYNFQLDGVPLIAFYDGSIKNIRVFKAILNNEKLDFKIEKNKIVDQNNIKLSVKGTSENNQALKSVTHFEVMWFAWYAFYPETEVIE